MYVFRAWLFICPALMYTTSPNSLPHISSFVCFYPQSPHWHGPICLLLCLHPFRELLSGSCLRCNTKWCSLKKSINTSLILMHAIMLIRLLKNKKIIMAEFFGSLSFLALSFLRNGSKPVNSKYISELWHTPSTCRPIRPAASVMVHRSTIITISSGGVVVQLGIWTQAKTSVLN